MRRLFFLLVLLLPSLYAPEVFPQEFFVPVIRKKFDLAVEQVFDERGNPGIVVNISVPYRRIIFFKKKDVYEARIRVYVELKDKRGAHVLGRVWEKVVREKSYKDTTAPKKNVVLKKRIPAKSGVNSVEVTVEIVGTSLKYRRKEIVNIISATSGSFEISKPSFKAVTLSELPPPGEISLKMVNQENDDAVPTTFRATYTELELGPRVEYSVVTSSDIGSDTVIVASLIRDAQGKIVLYSKEHMLIKPGGHAKIAVEFDISNLLVGFYSISTVLADVDMVEKRESKGKFIVVFNKALFSRYYSDLIEMISQVASESEVEKLAQAEGSERIDEWERFWKKKDPTPSTEENEEYNQFVERLVYVMQHFSRVKPGWKTDMGKVYIANGHPDRIVDRQGAMLGKYYEYWYYYSKGVVYIFEDALGNGDYRLLNVRML